ncbi:MAG: nucleotidyl transferase AbiEii/AbiGii toxin family protein [Candidatus Omnitrophota bacterium]
MDAKIRRLQERVLRVFSDEADSFALAGGTALELYYLKHRFSLDLDFFSPRYTDAEISKLVRAFSKKLDKKIGLEAEFLTPGRARVKFYTIPIAGHARPLKIDFVEDIILKRPSIRLFGGVRAYSAKDIYMMKIAAISGTTPGVDRVGREGIEGRMEARDAFDLYMLSKKIQSLHLFLREVPPLFQRGVIHWYRRFSRQDLKLALIDMDIYIKEFNPSEMIRYLESEIREFAKEMAE